MTGADSVPYGSETPGGVKKLIRSVVALPELKMRVAWLAERFEGRADESSAWQLDQLASWSQLSHDDAREAMLALAVLLAQRMDSAWLWALYQTAKRSGLIHLERLVRPTSSSGPPAREAVEIPVPNYGGARPLTVGERRTLARRPTRVQLERLLHDPHPLVIAQVLESPPLTEEDVITIATRRPAYVPALQLLAQSPRWIIRRRVRLSLILNPGCPHGLAVPFLSTCPREDLKLIIETTTTSIVLRAVAHELYQRLPPLDRQIQLEGIH